MNSSHAVSPPPPPPTSPLQQPPPAFSSPPPCWMARAPPLAVPAKRQGVSRWASSGRVALGMSNLRQLVSHGARHGPAELHHARLPRAACGAAQLFHAVQCGINCRKLDAYVAKHVAIRAVLACGLCQDGVQRLDLRAHMPAPVDLRGIDAAPDGTGVRRRQVLAHLVHTSAAAGAFRGDHVTEAMPQVATALADLAPNVVEPPKHGQVPAGAERGTRIGPAHSFPPRHCRQTQRGSLWCTSGRRRARGGRVGVLEGG